MLRRALTMSAVTLIVLGFALTTQLLTSPVQAQDVPEPMATPDSMLPKYEAVCAECHDSQGDDVLAPTRAALRQMDPERVLLALIDGPMAEFTSGFEDDELRAMAELVTGKPLSSSADRIVYPVRMVGAFENGCAVCHDNSPAGRPVSGGNAPGNMPSRFDIQQMEAEELLAVLSRPIAAHDESDRFRIFRDEAYKRATIELVTGKAFDGVAHREAAAMPNQCARPINLDNWESQPSWNGWDPELSVHRFASEEIGGITAEDLPRLKLKWAFGLPDAGIANWSQPSVVGGALFITSDNFFVYALDAKTGCVHWSYRAQTSVRGAVKIGPVDGVPGVRYGAYFGDMSGVVYGVNAETGEEMWTLRADEHPQAKITSAVRLDSSGERLYVPVASWEEQPGSWLEYECCTFQGNVVAIDVKTGTKVWQTYAFTERPRSLNKSNSADIPLFGPAGAGIWSSLTIDEERRAIYAPTGNCNITEHFGVGAVRFDDGACDSILALDMDTGRRLWMTNLLPASSDRDEGGCGHGPERLINCPGYVQGPGDDVNQAILLDLPNGRRALLGVQESGRITALDPDNDGAVLWVAQAGDRHGVNGAAWGGASDGELFYRPLLYRDSSGAVAALNVTTGERVWYTELPTLEDCDLEGWGACSSGITASATAVPGAVFAGSGEGTLRAYSKADGVIIWEYPTDQEYEAVNGVPAFGGGIGATSPTIVDGMMYIGSGYVIFGSKPGNVLLAFRIDD
ncbi:MAG TPA: PQQ-binding-like beta-propeller repeat protein [Acidobacteriota bacterium]|nr:PQQ-binding-like beta-propeller repeat protein [Acidobacteriota bacterium]